MIKKITKDWTVNDTEMLIRLWVNIESIMLISIIMNRTPSSIQTRALRIQLPQRKLDDSYRRKWEKKEDDYFKKIFNNENIDIFELSYKTKRTIDSILRRAISKYNISIQDIAKRIQLPDYQEIYNKGRAIGDGESKERICARCLKPFWSENFGNRICLPCKSTEDWIDS